MTDDTMTNWQARKSPFRQASPSSGLSGFVPKGLYDRNQAIYCLERVGNGVRPVGHGLIGESLSVSYSVPRDRVSCTSHTVPTGRVALLHVSQAMNCLATIIPSLRDDIPAPVRSHHSITPPLPPATLRVAMRARPSLQHSNARSLRLSVAQFPPYA
jgi:hypothetical protein